MLTVSIKNQRYSTSLKVTALQLSSLWVIMEVLSNSVDTARADAHPLALLVREEAAFSSSCEVAVNLEGVPRAALVWINPVFT